MIALIPARGGSKGLPGKNIKLLRGKPLIAYAIEEAKKCSFINHVVVSTDSEEIAFISRKYGAEIPFMRPAHLAEDTSSAVDVYIHAMKTLSNIYGKTEDKMMVLLPTAPMRTAAHIEAAYELFKNYSAKTLVSVREAPVPPSWYLWINKEGCLKNCEFGIKEGMTKNRQSESKYYVPNGAIYILDYNLLKEKRTYYCEDTIAYIMSGLVSVDIDTIDDFNYAEYLMNRS